MGNCAEVAEVLVSNYYPLLSITDTINRVFSPQYYRDGKVSNLNSVPTLSLCYSSEETSLGMCHKDLVNQECEYKDRCQLVESGHHDIKC